MPRREKIFWSIIGAAYAVGFLFLIPACNRAYQLGNAHHQQCSGNKVAYIAITNIAEFLDVHNWLVTALFAGLVTLFTWRLWQATDELRISTDKLWDAARATADIQERDTKILQRAYVSVEPLGLDLLIDGAHLLGLVSIKNSGNLPARNLSWSIRMLGTVDGEQESFPLKETQGNIVIAPHSETIRGADTRLVVSELLDAAGAGSQGGRMAETPIFIYVFGIIKYHDGFTEERTTRFCHRYNWKVRPQEAGKYGMSKELARQHSRGNESD